MPKMVSLIWLEISELSNLSIFKIYLNNIAIILFVFIVLKIANMTDYRRLRI